MIKGSNLVAGKHQASKNAFLAGDKMLKIADTN